MAITITEAAASRVATFLENRGKGIGLRSGVRTSGCSGMAYVLEFVDELEEGDQVFEEKGVKIIIDPKSLVYLDGTELDFAKEGLNEGFKFNNPNVSSECGCGGQATFASDARRSYGNAKAPRSSPSRRNMRSDRVVSRSVSAAGR